MNFGPSTIRCLQIHECILKLSNRKKKPCRCCKQRLHVYANTTGKTFLANAETLTWERLCSPFHEAFISFKSRRRQFTGLNEPAGDSGIHYRDCHQDRKQGEVKAENHAPSFRSASLSRQGRSSRGKCVVLLNNTIHCILIYIFGSW